MPVCNLCRSFFPIEENPERGDCVRREVDPRQAYYTARELDAGADASNCANFQKK
ncbi:MAG: benzylsuccinate synthase gamma subunit family protein [Proteobacteria bacterium]|nr:benzylsuccinate synthase gamma subunit family protein [Pseudomonadota bacterium]